MSDEPDRGPHTPPAAPDAEAAWRMARSGRILDAAARLILRFGYHQTSVADIAREAGVGKGTVYLHWKSREDLFAALILREKVAMAEDIQRRLAGDPAGATLRSLLKHSALALMQRPLFKAVLLRDTQMFGEMVQREQGSALSAEALVGFNAYLQGLRAQGLLRTDLSPQDQMGMLSAIFLGFFLAAPLIPDAFRPADERLAEQLAETAQRALEPRELVPSAARPEAESALGQYLDHSMSMAQDRLREGSPAGEAPSAGRARIKAGGRPRKLENAAKVAEARRLYEDGTRSIAEICAALGISRASLYRYLKKTGF